MEVRKYERDNLKEEYGVLVERLLPWPSLNAPFEGAMCVIEPGGATEPHSHHEHEIFIATDGTAVIESEGERKTFAAGDLAYLQPGQRHQIRNEGDAEFRFYSVWWDADMADRFKARHG
jgi:quercetin dioxygenase-like cupin family protein